ncbi:hypothetical protein [Rhizosphaericola mali]|uniref:Uncharacterized protein n=1 Tax=Rhizosphaericola mali TaxID=2545455 RepID=A0A5P2G5L9_9BACT|nr:hypothetical protein [Rhizosphaericola mali]QES88403.1 hypothetical protein E0W69_006935 [Rhizosphaericola mali]
MNKIPNWIRWTLVPISVIVFFTLLPVLFKTLVEFLGFLPPNSRMYKYYTVPLIDGISAALTVYIPSEEIAPSKSKIVALVIVLIISILALITILLNLRFLDIKQYISIIAILVFSWAVYLNIPKSKEVKIVRK